MTLMYVDSPLSSEIQIQVITTTHVCKIQSGYFVLCKDTIATNPPILLVPVKISHHLLGCERKICPPVWVAPWSTSTSWSKTAGDVPSCPCGPSGYTPPPPPFFTPPLSRQPPISYLLNTRPVPWEGFTAPSVVQFKRNPLERSQNSQPVFQIFSTMIILIGLLLSYSSACYSWRSTSLLLHICTYVASAPTYLHLHVHLHLHMASVARVCGAKFNRLKMELSQVV